VRAEGCERSKPAAMFTEVGSVLRGSASVSFEVVLVDGTTVRVPEHFEPGALRLLLGVLREC
jgi:hypothetical protein